MDENKYAATNKVVFTQQCEEGQVIQFTDVLTKLEEYAKANKLDIPKRQALLSWLFKKHLPSVTPEEFFSK